MRQNRQVPGRRLILVLVMLLVTLSVLSASRDISRRGPAGQGQQTTTATQPAQAPQGKDEAQGPADRKPQATPETTARANSGGVDGSLRVAIRPSASTTAISVKVPPISAAMRVTMVIGG